jgi:hypothetical protein
MGGFSVVPRNAGACCAFLIASGFFSGQEILQFFAGHGLPGVAGCANWRDRVARATADRVHPGEAIALPLDRLTGGAPPSQPGTRHLDRVAGASIRWTGATRLVRSLACRFITGERVDGMNRQLNPSHGRQTTSNNRVRRGT